jgi:hypothetical protein
MVTSTPSPAVSTISLKEGHAGRHRHGWLDGAARCRIGLYLNDVRFLSRFELTLDGQAPLLLSASDRETPWPRSSWSTTSAAAGGTLPRQALSIRRQGSSMAVCDGSASEQLAYPASRPGTRGRRRLRGHVRGSRLSPRDGCRGLGGATPMA